MCKSCEHTTYNARCCQTTINHETSYPWHCHEFPLLNWNDLKNLMKIEFQISNHQQALHSSLHIQPQSQQQHFQERAFDMISLHCNVASCSLESAAQLILAALHIWICTFESLYSIMAKHCRLPRSKPPWKGTDFSYFSKRGPFHESGEMMKKRFSTWKVRSKII